MADVQANDSLNELMARLRPRLHRYCARMVGSVFEGEDIVQETLAKAIEGLREAAAIENAERWLFAVAHNVAIDALRRRQRHAEVPLGGDSLDEHAVGTEADSWVAASASLATLMQLPVIQRSSVVLLDVLEYSLAEAVEILDSSLPAVKAAVHRGRARLKTLSKTVDADPAELDPEERARLRAYADTFNARDFDTLRDLLAEDVKLDVVNRVRLAGRKDVSVYFARYSERSDWRFGVGSAEGRPALLVTNPLIDSNAVEFVVLLEWSDGRIRGIRDFRHARYITDGLAFKRL